MDNHSPPLTALTEDQRQEALNRFKLLRPFLEDGVPLPRIAQEQHLSLRTLRRWVQHYRQYGLAGLVRHSRADRGHRCHLPPDLQTLIEGFALQRPKRSIAAIYRQVTSLAPTRGWSPPSYSQVYQIIKQLDPGLVVLAHEGAKSYQETYDVIMRYETSAPNDIWQADHTLLDILLLDEHGKKARPWLTIILDDYSRTIAGYSIGFQAPSALTTALTLRQAIWRKEDPRWHICGIPAVFYTDHGSDFTSQHLEQVAVDLKMVLHFSWPNVPRGRGKIERFFNTVNQMLLADLPGFLAPGSPDPAAPLTLPEFDARFRAWLLGDYHFRVHGGTDCPPQERWEAGGFLPHTPRSLEELDLLLLTVRKSRRIHQDGIYFQGRHYFDLTLASYVGEDVLIRYDPQDMAEIRIYYRNSFLCRAICAELAGEQVSLKEIIQARTKRRKQLRTMLHDRNAKVREVLGNTPSSEGQEEFLPPAPLPEPPRSPSRLKRYINE